MRTISKKFLVLLIPLCLNAQSPSSDLHWNSTNLKFQEDFNSLWPYWSVMDHNTPGNPGHQTGVYERSSTNTNIINYSNGTAWPHNVLELSTTHYNTTPICQNTNAFITMGEIFTGGTNAFRYGYYEARCHFGLATGNTYMPAFWLMDGGSNYYNELDCEIRSAPSGPFELTNTNWVNNFSSTVPFPATPATFTNAGFKPGLENGFHKYGIEWLPNHVIYYYDDKPYACTWDVINNVPQFPMRIRFSMGFAYNPPFTEANNTFPGRMLVDYTYAYDLNMQNCGTKDLDVFTPFNMGSYDFMEIKKNIYFIINNNTNFNNGQLNILRASNEIQIEGDWRVSLGTEVQLIPSSCYIPGE